MAAITALANIGYPHPNDGGLRPECIIQLSEGDRPAWVFDSAYIWGTSISRPPRQVVWIPTLDTMAEDLMLMIGVHVLQDQELIKMMQDAGLDPVGRRLDLVMFLMNCGSSCMAIAGKLKAPGKWLLPYLRARLSRAISERWPSTSASWRSAPAYSAVLSIVGTVASITSLEHWRWPDAPPQVA